MNFDLNIENYTKQELVDMFGLPPNFDKNILDIKELKIRESILKNTEITKETQSQTINFLIKAKNIILESKNNIPDLYNTSYQLKMTNINDEEEHMVQNREATAYLPSYPSEFFPGVINPLKKRTIKNNLNIDTRFRNNYQSSLSSNFNIGLPTNFNNVIQMQLSSFEIPTTYYLISRQYGNNYFNLTVNGNTVIVTIPDGNYDKSTIMSIINRQLLNLSSTTGITDFKHVVFIANITGDTTGSGQTIVGFDGGQTYGADATMELNFCANDNGVDDYDTPLALKFGWILGFRNGIYKNNQNYVSEGIIDVKGPKYLFLVVDDYKNNVNNSFYSAFNSSILNKNILARISLDSTSTNIFNVLQQSSSTLVTTPREYFGPVNLNNLTIQLLDEYGRIIDMNNMDYSFCLTLTTVYDI